MAVLYVKVTALVLYEHKEWDEIPIWIPREIALSQSQDSFQDWLYTMEAKALIDTLDKNTDLSAIFISNFAFEENEGADQTFVPVGTRVVLVRSETLDSVPRNWKAVGKLLQPAIVGADAPHELCDVLFDDRDEVSVYADQLDLYVELN